MTSLYIAVVRKAVGLQLARRKDHTREELSNLVVATATKTIANKGLDALTTRVIAQQIGYSPGSIYNVFANLDAVIWRVNTNTLLSLGRELDRVELTGNALGDGNKLLDAYLSFSDANPLLMAAILQHESRQDLARPEHFAEALRTAFKHVEEALAPLFQDRPDLSGQTVVRVLWAALQGISGLQDSAEVLVEGGGNRASMSRHLVETYLRGLQAGAPNS